MQKTGSTLSRFTASEEAVYLAENFSLGKGLFDIILGKDLQMNLKKKLTLSQEGGGTFRVTIVLDHHQHEANKKRLNPHLKK